MSARWCRSSTPGFVWSVKVCDYVGDSKGCLVLFREVMVVVEMWDEKKSPLCHLAMFCKI